MVEVLIAGAGPAGSAAGLVLARAGVRVLIVDRARFPRPKLCGDTLNPGALAVLEALGLRSGIEPLGLPLDGMRVTSSSGLAITGRYGGFHGLALSRQVLDEHLLRAAARAGAQVQEGVRVLAPILDDSLGHPIVRGAVLQTRQGPLRLPAHWTIGADGRRSALAIAMRLSRHPARPRRWALGAYYDGVGGMVPFGEMHIRPGHYVGLAPLREGLTNVCIVTGNRADLAHPTALLRRVLSEDPALCGRFDGARRVSDPVCVGPLAVDAWRCGTDGLLLAGDAAGFIDPMTGDGLRFALRGGMLAAEAVLHALERPAVPAHRRLASARREFAGKQRLNRTLRRLIDSRPGLAAGTLVARWLPGLVQRVIRRAGDLPRAAAAPLR